MLITFFIISNLRGVTPAEYPVGLFEPLSNRGRLYSSANNLSTNSPPYIGNWNVINTSWTSSGFDSTTGQVLYYRRSDGLARLYNSVPITGSSTPEGMGIEQADGINNLWEAVAYDNGIFWVYDNGGGGTVRSFGTLTDMVNNTNSLSISAVPTGGTTWTGLGVNDGSFAYYRNTDTFLRIYDTKYGGGLVYNGISSGTATQHKDIYLVPEPSSFLLLISAISMLLFNRRRK